MKGILSIFIAFIINTNISFSQSTSVSFYIAAHPDDWALFMGVNAFKDIESSATGNKKVVMIYITAGESNCNGNGVNIGFYYSRQDGANHAIQFCSDIYSPHSKWTDTNVIIHGITDHKIVRLQYKNVVSYYLRLPDGCFEAVHNTIKKLAAGTITSISAIDNSTTYHSYNDLLFTIKKIVENERSGITKTWINTFEWDTSINPHDHPDHVQTGLLATAISQTIPCANVFLFEGYNTCAKPANLNPDEIAMEASLHSHLSYCKSAAGFGSEWDPESSCGHVSWTSRNYFRLYKSCDAAYTKNKKPKM